MELAIIGVDGLDPRLLEQWSDNLPTLNHLCESGGFGTIQSTYPPLTCPAWPSLVTGKQGGKHGLYGFLKPEDDGREWTSVDNSDRTSEAIWQVADREGKSTAVVNVPFTYPPDQIDSGLFISGWPVPNRSVVTNEPETLAKLEKSVGEEYQVNPFPTKPEYDHMSPERTKEEIIKGMWHHHRFFLEIIEDHQPDLFFGVYMAMDPAGHYLSWDREELKRAYREQDEALAEVLETIPDRTNLIVVSDHGHGAKSEYSFWTNNWLHQTGYQDRFGSRASKRRDGFRKVGLTQENAIKVKNWVWGGDIREVLPQRIFDILEWAIPAEDEAATGFDPKGVCWSTSVAFSPLRNVVYINDGRFGGVVDDEDTESVREELLEDMLDISHPNDKTKQLLTDFVTKDYFEGPYEKMAPDIVFIPDEMKVNTPTGLEDDIWTPDQFGEHQPSATLITHGESFADVAGKCEMGEIYDVFPLAAAVLDVAVPANIDGQLFKHRLEGTEELEERPPRGTSEATQTRLQEDDDDVKDQLRDLGYLE